MALEYQLPYTGEQLQLQLSKIDQLDLHEYIYVNKSFQELQTNESSIPVKFATVKYDVLTREEGILAKLTMAGSHGNGMSYVFWQDAIISVDYDAEHIPTPQVHVRILKYHGNETTFKGNSCQYGDIFWIEEGTNIHFYCIMGQYAFLRMTPWQRLNPSSRGAITYCDATSTSFTVPSGAHMHPATNCWLFTPNHLNRKTAITEDDTDYTTFMARGTSLNSEATAPPKNGMIAWTYE